MNTEPTPAGALLSPPPCSASSVHFSSASDDWPTPQDFFDRMNALHGPLELDVCASPTMLDLSGGYSVILADPPWKYYGDPNKDQACGKHYNCMTPEQIASLPIKALCAPRAVVMVWATCPMLDVAIDTIRAWGLHYRGVAYVWVKTRADGGIISGQGVRPTITKPTTELVLAASNVKRGRPLRILQEGQGQVVLAPRREHSQKPDEIQARIETLFGDVRRLEMFARRRRPGWEAWGNEV